MQILRVEVSIESVDEADIIVFSVRRGNRLLDENDYLKFISEKLHCQTRFSCLSISH